MSLGAFRPTTYAAFDDVGMKVSCVRVLGPIHVYKPFRKFAKNADVCYLMRPDVYLCTSTLIGCCFDGPCRAASMNADGNLA